MADSEKDVIEPPHFTYTWTIENMSFPCVVYSPSFIVKEMEMTQWYLNIKIKTCEFAQLYIIREDESVGPKSIEVKCELSFLGIDGLALIKKTDVKKFSYDSQLEFSEFVHWNKVFFQRRAEFLPKDALTIRCRMWRTGTEIRRIDSCFARTRLRLDRHSFVWAVREFSTLHVGQERKILLNQSSVNRLTFTLNLTEKNDEECIHILVRKPANFQCNIKISLLDFEGKVFSQEKSENYLTSLVSFDFLKKDRLMNDKDMLLPDDVLTLRCEVETRTEIEWEVIENYRNFSSLNSGVIATDAGDVLRYGKDEAYNITEAMKSLVEEGTLSDVTLQTDSKSFPAHKCILGARSPVFKAMFSGDMKEKTSKCVEIPDVEDNTLERLLSYIYTDTVEDLESEEAIDLYRVADKYELLDLKRRCVSLLKSDLSVSNVCEVLSVADMHHDLELQKVAQEFVMQQRAEFFKSNMWQSFKLKNPALTLDIVEEILCSMKR